MPGIYGCGSNLYGQLRPQEHDNLSFETPIELLSHDPDEKPPAQLVAVSESQRLVRSNGQLSLTGFPLEDSEVLQEASASAAKVLGRSHFVAYLDKNGYLVDIANQDRRSKDAYYDATIDGHGRVLVISKDNTLRFSKTLSDVIEGVSEPVSLNHELSSTSRLYSGAAHFLINVSANILYSLGSENRFFQLGHDNRNVIATRAEQLCMFEGGSPIRKIACGDMHSAVVTEDGALYVFGSDAQGQCGGFSDSEPSLVEFQVDEGTEQPDVLDVACGSRHTVVLTDQGVYATGSSALSGIFNRLTGLFNEPDQVGQLGLGDCEDRKRFTKCALPADMSVPTSIAACGWNTFYISET